MSLNINKEKLFLETHIGGNLDDNVEEFNDQKEIIKEGENNYIETLNLNTENKRKHNKKLLHKEKYEKNYRQNNVPTIIDENVNISNPIIYPREYDPYFEYLSNKNLNPINNQVILEKTRINIDSANRNVLTTSTVESFVTLQNNPLLFKNDSSTMTILVDNKKEKFSVNDKISLMGVDVYNINYKGMKFFFKNHSNEVILNIYPNYEIPIPYYNIMIKIQNVTNNGLDYFKNIPLNIINTIVPVTIDNDNGDLKLKFNIPIPFYTDNELDSTITSDCIVTFYSLGNYPLNLVNAHYPITEYNLTGSYTVLHANDTSIHVKLLNEISLTNTINLQGNWINDIFYTGGSNIQIAKINNIEKGYFSMSNYKIPLKKIMNNIVSIKMIGSEFPDTQKVFDDYVTQNKITISNNNFYWENAIDVNSYKIVIPVGNYNIEELKITMETLISNVKRTFVDSTNIYPYNDMNIDFDRDSNMTSITSFNNYILPDSLISVTNDSIIKINQKQHNLQVGDNIIIKNSTDFKKISNIYINMKHIVTNVLDSDNYEITLENINLIADVGDTHGGKEIIIKTHNSFRLFFNESNTCGKQIGFKYSGFSGSVTPFCNINNNYTIKNTQSYIFDISKILTVNNKLSNIEQSSRDINLSGYNYFLIQCNNFNQNLNPNGIDYFYKIQLNRRFANDNILFNTFVDAPITFNPPLKMLDSFDFTFYNPIGDVWNFYNTNHSFTLEITEITNYPENTNLSTYISRI